MWGGKIFNTQGVHVATVIGSSIFGLRGEKLYDLRGTNIYKLSGELVGHLATAVGGDKHLGKVTDKLFPAPLDLVKIHSLSGNFQPMRGSD
jgi:hypothetical protein